MGPNEGNKLRGLIGVRLDTGVTLDSTLLELEMVSVKQDERGRWLEVDTREQWHYLDRSIGTGEQVGEDSRDEYEMRYIFRKNDGRWLVDKIKFRTPPKVGRKKLLWAPGTTHPNGGMVMSNSDGGTNTP